MSINLLVMEKLVEHYGQRMSEDLKISQDALIVTLDNGVALEYRFASDTEYSINWLWGDAAMRIDTAPLHRELSTFPNHLHDSDDNLHADPLTRPGADPFANLSAVLDAVLAEPLLNSRLK